MSEESATPTQRLEAQSYLESLGFVQVIDNALNKICRSQPKDPFGHVAEMLREQSVRMSSPEIVSVEAGTAVGIDGGEYISIDVFCNNHGRQNMLCGTALYPKSEKLEQDETVDAASTCAEIVKGLSGQNPKDLAEIDKVLASQDSSALSMATSIAVASAAGFISGIPSYRTIATLAAHEVKPDGMPKLMISGIGCRGSGGKAKIISVDFLVKSEGSFLDAIKTAKETYKALQITIENKFGVGCSYPGRDGRFRPPKIDKVEAALDLVKEACMMVDNGASQEILVHVDAPGCWNVEKGKYELIQGAQKSAEDIVKDISGWTKACPLICSLIQPFNSEHSLQLNQLLEGTELSIFEHTNASVLGPDVSSARHEFTVPTAEREDAIAKLFAEIDRNNSGKVTYKEFMKWMRSKHPLLVDEQEERDAILASFKEADENDDTSIDSSEFTKLLQALWDCSKEQPIIEHNGGFMTVTAFSTISEMATVAKSFHEKSRCILFSNIDNDLTSSYSLGADLAVGIGANIFHIGGFTGSGAVACNRLTKIFKELTDA